MAIRTSVRIRKKYKWKYGEMIQNNLYYPALFGSAGGVGSISHIQKPIRRHRKKIRLDLKSIRRLLTIVPSRSLLWTRTRNANKVPVYRDVIIHFIATSREARFDGQMAITGAKAVGNQPLSLLCYHFLWHYSSDEALF